MKADVAKRFALCAVLSLLACHDQDHAVTEGLESTNNQAALLLPRNDSAKALLAIYMVGGQLEDSILVPSEGAPDDKHQLPAGERGAFGAASDDLRELAEGFSSLPEQARKNLRAWIAFGGANKPGWRGIRYADLACLAKDAADDVFGNADCYAKSEDSDMSSPETLGRFLRFVAAPERKARGQSEPVSVLVLWGQGGAYRGMFHDSAGQKPAFLALPQLKQTLSHAGTHFDVIALDSGMMATLEVADAFRSMGRYLVASADLAPSHGWDYRALLQSVASSARSASVDVAKGIAAGFMQGKSISFEPSHPARRVFDHANSSGKSISVIDTQGTAEVISALDRFANASRPTFAFLSSALADAPNYGRERRLRSLYTVDLRDVVRGSKNMVAELALPADDLLKALGGTVLYAERDETTRDSGGLSVFTPLAERLWTRSYEGQQFLSDDWYAFNASFLERSRSDLKPPKLRLQKGDRSSRILQVTDDVALLSVEALRAEGSAEPAVLRIWGSTPPTVLERSNQGRTQLVKVGAWDGRGHWLCSGPCRANHAARVPTYFEGLLKDGSLLYSTSVVVRDFAKDSEGKEAVLFMRAPLEGPVQDSWFVLFEADANGDVLFYRQQFRLTKGLTVAFYALDYNVAKRTESYQRTEFLNLERTPSWRYFPVAENPSTLAYLVAARDLHRNVSASAVFPLSRHGAISRRPKGQRRSVPKTRRP